MLTLLSSPHTLLSLGSVVTGANWSLLGSSLSTLLSFSSSPLSLSQSLSNAATNANWSLLRSEAVVGAAHSVGTRILESLTARCSSSLLASNPRARKPSLPLSPPPISTSFPSHLARLRAALVRKAGPLAPTPAPLSALAGARACLASSFLPPLPGSFPAPSPPPVKRSVSFHPTVCCKAISDASDLRRWDRDADLRAVCYTVPLSVRRVRFKEEVQMAWAWNYLIPDGCNQVFFPRTRWVSEGVVLGKVDDEGDVEMGGL